MGGGIVHDRETGDLSTEDGLRLERCSGHTAILFVCFAFPAHLHKWLEPSESVQVIDSGDGVECHIKKERSRCPQLPATGLLKLAEDFAMTILNQTASTA